MPAKSKGNSSGDTIAWKGTGDQISVSKHIPNGVGPSGENTAAPSAET